MSVVSTATHDVAGALQSILTGIQNVITKTGCKQQVRLLAVSKTKPPSAVQSAYDAGQRHFGENYVAELLAKAPQCPSDIKWHFIGHLQSNKAAKLAALPNLYQVECIDSFRLASKLSRACENAGRKNKLRVLIQVNTSGEQSKSGCAPSDCVNLVTEVHQNCKSLQVVGLMTIGAYEAEPSSSFFDVLNQCKSEVFQAIPELKSDDFEMSMGMSHDYDLAIACGSTEVRVGTAIFGSRGPLMVFNDSDDDGEAADGKKKATAASSSSTSTSTSTAAAAAVDKDVSDEKTR